MTNTEIMTYDAIDEARADQAAKNVGNMGTYCGSLKVYTISAIREAARLAREGWTPPVAVDPDKAEAITLAKGFGMAHYIPVLEAIKRGRALAAEAKPGMVWVKHDGGPMPTDRDEQVAVIYDDGELIAGVSHEREWSIITHYAIITPPEEK